MSNEVFEFVTKLKTDRRIEGHNEEQIKQAVVLRVLHLLGWDTWDADEVSPEYSVGNRRVDFALRVASKNKVFVEVKKTSEDLGNHQSQLLEYCYEQGVKLAVLTNGRRWWFYLPGEEGTFEQRKFLAIDLFQNDPAAVCTHFCDCLLKENVASGRAVSQATEIYRSQQRKTIAWQALPEAWRGILCEPDELLVELMAERTEKLCGHKPETDLVQEFLAGVKEALLPGVPSKPKTTPLRAEKPGGKRMTTRSDSFAGKRPQEVVLKGQRYPVRHWQDVLMTICSLVLSGHPEKSERALAMKGRKRPLFAHSVQGMTNPKRINGTNLFVEGNWSADSVVVKCKQILSHFGYREDDFRVI